MRVYDGNREQAIEATLDGDPLADFIKNLLKKIGATWTWTAGDLLQAMNEKLPETITKKKDWYAKPRQVSDELRRLTPALRQVGIEVERTREPHTRRRLIALERVGFGASPSSPSVQSPEIKAGAGDEPGDAGGERGTHRPPKPQ